MNSIEQNLANWKASLLSSIPLGGLFSRNATVYKWKAPFRCWNLREAAFWRTHDLMSQSYALHQLGHGLGARILLRSGFETLATLIYLNQLSQGVLDGTLNFHAFGQKTSILLLGSKNNSTQHKSLNIMTVLDKCNKRYPGIAGLYAELSESAHPNYEGLCSGYSKIDHDEYETIFSNRWMEKYGDRHLDSMNLCMETFHYEYDTVWPDLISKLESWIEANDAQLEATKNDPIPAS
ncbi:hypothetical protein [Bosea sp. (in: a-proteobacteria)]|uniref:hypothetical protein n=1 Tax=Bosea sp. (in: a-proteobacteria) TaxID=1871050 RepID=UPI001ACCBE71|nr:hypothetical protein [Bosea sp. (in: a-proteobacteria)]MBN9437151.1 hypothetical protein [Bosea sp. (in: a-proteobacteria)]